jgi:hypothetical protein
VRGDNLVSGDSVDGVGDDSLQVEVVYRWLPPFGGSTPPSDATSPTKQRREA